MGRSTGRWPCTRTGSGGGASATDGQQQVTERKNGYHLRSVAETAMSRVKKVCGGRMKLRNYDGQVGESMALVKAFKIMTLLDMPHSVRIA